MSAVMPEPNRRRAHHKTLRFMTLANVSQRLLITLRSWNRATHDSSGVKKPGRFSRDLHNLHRGLSCGRVSAFEHPRSGSDHAVGRSWSRIPAESRIYALALVAWFWR